MIRVTAPKQSYFAVIAVLMVVACAPEAYDPELSAADPMLSEEDHAAIRQAHIAYRDAWRANDPDAVLMPHHGAPVVAGAEAIRGFWFPPDSPPANVTVFDTTIDEVGGSGDVGYLRGTFSLSFEYGGQTFSNAGNFMEVARRQEDGGWLISHRIWNDPVPQVE